MKVNWRSILTYSLLILVGIMLVAPLFSPEKKVQEVAFSEFLNYIDQSKVKEVTIAGDLVSGVLADKSLFRTRALNYPNLIPTLREKGVSIKVEPPMEENWLISLLMQLLAPVAFFGLLWLLMLRQAQGVNTQAMSFGRANIKPQVGKVNVTFADVAGVDEAKDELKEIVDFLKFPGKFHALGAKIPKGLLLMGAPGTGKTLLARAIAGEADVPFFSISGSDFVEMFVGVGAARVRSVFERAKKQTPSIIFMDEVDAVGRQRGAGLGGGHDEREQTLNQLLVEMDGFDPKQNIIVLAATNRPDILDPALLRPGRFDRQIVLDKPDLKGREAILKIHARGKPFAGDVDLKVVAQRTSGFTGADLENVLNEAAILAVRVEKKEVTMEEIEEAVDRVMAGPEKKSRVISDKEKKMVAYHEVGHAVLSRILPRGMALGYTLQLPLEDKYLVTRSQALDQITVMMGGRVAEEIIFNEMTSGAHNDLERATALAKRMVTEFCMSALGPRTFGRKDRQIFLGRDIAEMKDYSEQTADAIDREVENIINSCYGRAKELLAKNRVKLEAIAKVLIEKESLEDSDLEEAVKDLHSA